MPAPLTLLENGGYPVHQISGGGMHIPASFIAVHITLLN
jgi:hypothetical protein